MMKNLALVLKSKLQKTSTRKQQGGIHILLIGLFLWLFILCFFMFLYKQYSFALLDETTDDALTDALLASGTVNIAEYGKSGQIILSDNLVLGPITAANPQNTDKINRYLSDDVHDISWVYPEYERNGQEDLWWYTAIPGSTTKVFDRTTRQYADVSKSELDLAMLDYIKNIPASDQNIELTKAKDNFLDCFEADFSLDKGSGPLQFYGTKFDEFLTTETEPGTKAEQPIYVDFITVYNVYKHYITDTDGQYMYYPTSKDNGATITITIGNKTYSSDTSDSASHKKAQDLYKVCKENALCGSPIYDEYIVTQSAYRRTNKSSGSAEWVKVPGTSKEQIIECDYLDLAAMSFTNSTSQFIIDSSSILSPIFTPYVQANGKKSNSGIGVCAIGNQTVYTAQRKHSTFLPPVYSLSNNPASDAAKNKSNIAVYNTAVMAQVTYDLQLMAYDEWWMGKKMPSNPTKEDYGIHTAHYSRIIDITVSD